MPDAGPPPGDDHDPGPPDGGDPGPPPVRWRVIAPFLRYLRPARGVLVLLLLSTALTALVPLPMSFLPMVLTEHFDEPAFLHFYLAFVLITSLGGWVLGVFETYWAAVLGETIVRGLRRDLFGNLERLSMAAVYARGPGQYAQQLNRDVGAVQDLFARTLVGAARDVAMGVAVLVSMCVLAPVQTVVLLAVLLLMAWPIRAVNRRLQRQAGTARDLMEAILHRLVDYVGGFRDIIAAGRFRAFAERFDRLFKQSQDANVRTAVLGQLAGLVPAVVVGLAVLAVYYVGVFRAASVADVGAVIVYASLFYQLFPAVHSAAQVTTNMARDMPSFAALRQTLDQPGQAARPDAVPLDGPVRSIRFDRVTLELDGRRVVEDLSFDIPGGRLTAIVGQSGAGKTTVFHLLLRLIEPTSGTILINDRPVETYTLESLRAQVGFIPQNPFIFNESLRENVLLASPEATPPEKLHAAVGLAQLEEVVALRQAQGGLDALAGYMGSRLSGGEKQRVALARLALRDPQVIVCDEYTANVDVKTAALIQDAMRAHFAGRTRVVISHELYSARGADRIVVIDHGRVVQQGTHEELCDQPGLYRDLLEVQKI